MHLILSFAAFVTSFAIAAKLLEGMTVKGGVGSHMLAALVYGALSTLFSWLLFLVIGALSLGVGFLLAPLTYLVANAILLMVASKLTSKLTVDGFGTALKASLLMAIFGFVTRFVVGALT